MKTRSRLLAAVAGAGILAGQASAQDRTVLPIPAPPF